MEKHKNKNLILYLALLSIMLVLSGCGSMQRYECPAYDAHSPNNFHKIITHKI